MLHRRFGRTNQISYLFSMIGHISWTFRLCDQLDPVARHHGGFNSNPHNGNGSSIIGYSVGGGVEYAFRAALDGDARGALAVVAGSN
jgi:hypothetical protein